MRLPKRLKKRHAGAIAAAALCVLLILYVAFTVTQPKLVEYVSPPLDESGARLHILIPNGWHQTFSHQHGPLPINKRDDLHPWPLQKGNSAALSVWKGERFAGLPFQIRRLLPGTEPYAHIETVVECGIPAASSRYPAVSRWSEGVARLPWATLRSAEKTIASPDGHLRVHILYMRTNKRGFDDTKRQVIESAFLR